MSRSALSLPPFRNLQRLAMLRTGCSVDRGSLIWLRMLSCQMRTESSIFIRGNFGVGSSCGSKPVLLVSNVMHKFAIELRICTRVLELDARCLVSLLQSSRSGGRGRAPAGSTRHPCSPTGIRHPEGRPRRFARSALSTALERASSYSTVPLLTRSASESFNS